MSVTKAVQQITEPNPLDFVPDEIPFDIPYGAPISLERAQAAINAAVAEAKKRSWKMNVAQGVIIDAKAVRRHGLPGRARQQGRRGSDQPTPGREQMIHISIAIVDRRAPRRARVAQRR